MCAMEAREINSSISGQWARVRGRLRADVGEAAFRSWLKPLTLMGIGKGVVRMAVPTRFMRDWVQSNYAEQIRLLWGDEDEQIRKVEIVVLPPNRPAPKPGSELRSPCAAETAEAGAGGTRGAGRNGSRASTTPTGPQPGPPPPCGVEKVLCRLMCMQSMPRSPGRTRPTMALKLAPSQ